VEIALLFAFWMRIPGNQNAKHDWQSDVLLQDNAPSPHAVLWLYNQVIER